MYVPRAASATSLTRKLSGSVSDICTGVSSSWEVVIARWIYGPGLKFKEEHVQISIFKIHSILRIQKHGHFANLWGGNNAENSKYFSEVTCDKCLQLFIISLHFIYKKWREKWWPCKKLRFHSNNWLFNNTAATTVPMQHLIYSSVKTVTKSAVKYLITKLNEIRNTK